MEVTGIMSSILEVSEEASWSVQSWVYDAALRSLAAELESSNAELAQFLLRMQTDHGLEESFGMPERDIVASGLDYGFGFCELTSLDTATFRKLVDGIYKAFDRATVPEMGVFRAEFYSEISYMTFITGFSVLKALLRTDPRSGENQSISGSLLIREGVLWTAPAWAYDMVLELMHGYLSLEDREFARKLLASRANNTGNAIHDLRAVEELLYSQLVEVAKAIRSQYGGGGRNAAIAPTFRSHLSPKVEELTDLIVNDPRVY